MAETVIVSNDTTATSTSALMDEITMAKTFAMVVLGLGSFVLGVIPIKLTKWWRKSPSGTPSPSHSSSGGGGGGGGSGSGGHTHGGDDVASGSPVVSLLLCFGGGVLLFTTLLHLQPEVREGVSRLQRSGMLPSGAGTENLGDLIFCAGFFLVFLIDEVVHSILDGCAAAHPSDDDSADEVLHRSMSLRRRTMSIPRASLSGSPSSAPSSNGDASTASIKELLKESKEKRYRPWETSMAVVDDRRVQNHHQFDDRDTEKQAKPDGAFAGNNSFRGLFAVLALSFHEVFEGLAIGLEERIENMWYLFIAVATHKLVIAFCIGLELAWSKTRKPVLVMYVATFAVVTPIGIIIGMGLIQYGTGGSVDGSSGRVAVVLQGLAAGTLLYVVFFEVLARHKQSGFSHLLSIIAGFCILFGLQMISKYTLHNLKMLN